MSARSLEDLLAEEAEVHAEHDRVTERLSAVRQAVLEARFRDVEHFEEGDIVLVPRTLFGKPTMWPARIEQVRLNYNTGTTQAGEWWETKTVSYSVRLANRARDGFVSTSEGFYHRDVKPVE